MTIGKAMPIVIGKPRTRTVIDVELLTALLECAG